MGDFLFVPGNERKNEKSCSEPWYAPWAWNWGCAKLICSRLIVNIIGDRLDSILYMMEDENNASLLAQRQFNAGMLFILIGYEEEEFILCICFNNKISSLL